MDTDGWMDGWIYGWIGLEWIGLDWIGLNFDEWMDGIGNGMEFNGTEWHASKNEMR